MPTIAPPSDTLKVWESPAIELAKSNTCLIIIRKNLLSLTRWLRESHNNFPRLIQASGLQGHALIDVIASGIEERSDKYTSGALFGLCEIMAPSLTKEDANKLTKWYIDRLGEKVPQDVVARFSLTEMPDDFDQAIGRFLFAQFSDIDLRCAGGQPIVYGRLQRCKVDGCSKACSTPTTKRPTELSA